MNKSILKDQKIAGYVVYIWIPQMPLPSTAAILMYPWSPQEELHEFLTI